MKRIAFCADGTWDGQSNNTNVFKIFNAIQVRAQQLPFYDSGVGADGNPIEKLLGGAFGTGLFQKVKDGYTRIAHGYESGDQVFIFGFSRGAYTARSIAGMIGICGLPTKDFDDSLVETAFQAYRNKDQRASLLSGLGKYGMENAEITMVGVWDTVGSLGIPSVFGGVDPVLYGFLDTSLNPRIKNAYQALAIDERRAEFPPTLWTSQPAPGQTMEQLWFCGVHCDVGGGYKPGDADTNTTLSDITLGWMMSKAQALGLQFASAAVAQYTMPLKSACAFDQLHDSWNPLWGVPVPRKIAANSSLANSVAMRCQNQASGYRPSNLTLQNGVPIPGYGSVAVVA